MSKEKWCTECQGIYSNCPICYEPGEENKENEMEEEDWENPCEDENCSCQAYPMPEE